MCDLIDIDRYFLATVTIFRLLLLSLFTQFVDFSYFFFFFFFILAGNQMLQMLNILTEQQKKTDTIENSLVFIDIQCKWVDMKNVLHLSPLPLQVHLTGLTASK